MTEFNKTTTRYEHWDVLSCQRVHFDKTLLYVFVVELKAGPIFAFSSVKTGPFVLFILFFVFENLVLPAERRVFSKK